MSKYICVDKLTRSLLPPTADVLMMPVNSNDVDSTWDFDIKFILEIVKSILPTLVYTAFCCKLKKCSMQSGTKSKNQTADWNLQIFTLTTVHNVHSVLSELCKYCKYWTDANHHFYVIFSFINSTKYLNIYILQNLIILSC